MTIASELTALQTDITNARTAITNKGGTVTSGGGSSQLSTDIATIPSGGGENWNDFQEVEWIQSGTGDTAPCILTDFVPGTHNYFAFQVKFISPSGMAKPNHYSLCGWASCDRVNYFALLYFLNSGYLRALVGPTYYNLFTVEDDTEYDVFIECNNGVCHATGGGIDITFSSYATSTTNLPTGILCRYDVLGGVLYKFGNMIKRFRYWCGTSSSDLVIDMKPCYRKSNNEVGMFDFVHNKFYPNNAGTSTNFIKGPDVT